MERRVSATRPPRKPPYTSFRRKIVSRWCVLCPGNSKFPQGWPMLAHDGRGEKKREMDLETCVSRLKAGVTDWVILNKPFIVWATRGSLNHTWSTCDRNRRYYINTHLVIGLNSICILLKPQYFVMNLYFLGNLYPRTSPICFRALGLVGKRLTKSSGVPCALTRFCLLLFFFQFYWDIIDIQHCMFKLYSMIWLTSWNDYHNEFSEQSSSYTDTKINFFI